MRRVIGRIVEGRGYVDLEPSTETDRARLEEVCVLQQPPGTKGTDRAFMSNKHNREFDGMTPDYIDLLKKNAAEAGVSTSGKFYSFKLAERQADPRAWISGLDDAKRRCVETGQGWEEMGIKREDFDAHPRETYEVDESIVDSYVQDAIDENPEIAPTPKERVELKEKIREKITPDFSHEPTVFDEYVKP